MGFEWDADPIRPRVPLLDLPVELIEKIFIYSENLRLALNQHASPPYAKPRYSLFTSLRRYFRSRLHAQSILPAA